MYTMFSVILLTAGFLHYWRKVGIKDIPSQRSAHNAATPTAGGVCLGCIFLVFSCLANAKIILLETLSFAAIVGFVILLIVGFLDDWKELNYKARLFSHALAVSLVLVQQNLSIAEYGVWFFIGVGLVNACNFLDGLNGLLASQWLLTFGFLLCSFVPFNNIFWVLWISTLVYLFFNFPKARIFIGDTGSTILGFSYFVVIFSLAFSTHGFPSFILPNDSFVVFSLFPLAIAWADVIFTIIKRFIDKRSIVGSFGDYGFHYQSRFFKSHSVVTLIYLGFNAILTFLAAISFLNHHYIYVVFVFYVVLQILHWVFIYRLSQKYTS